MESQALAEELICGTVYYGEVELHSGEMVSKAPKVRTEGSDNSSITSFGRPSKKSSSETTSAVSRERARAAAGEADLSKLKEKQLKEKAQLEAKIAAQEPQLEAELAIQEAEHEASRREIEALLLKEHLHEFNLSDRVKDFEDNPVVADTIKTETTPQIKQDAPINYIEDSKQKVTEWLKTVRPKGKETGEGKENDRAKHLPRKERIVDFSQSALSTSAMISSLPKRHLPVFDGDPCAWPNWYGMFKALVDDQQLSKTPKNDPS